MSASRATISVDRKRIVWFGLLLPQFALLLLIANDDLRELRHELQYHFPRMMTVCLPLSPFSWWEFGGELLGLAAVIGLCGLRRWGRPLYILLAAWVFVATVSDVVRPPYHWSLLLIDIPVAATLILSFWPGFVEFRHSAGRQ